MNTKMEYVYRDSGNYKIWTGFILNGEMTEEQVRLLTPPTAYAVGFHST